MAIITWSTLEQAGAGMKNPFQSSRYPHKVRSSSSRLACTCLALRTGLCVLATSFCPTEEFDVVFSRNQRLRSATVVMMGNSRIVG